MNNSIPPLICFRNPSFVLDQTLLAAQELTQELNFISELSSV